MLKNSPVYATLPVVDLERARKFYSEKLGLDCDAAQDGFCNVKANGMTFQLFQREATKADNSVLAFPVKNVEETVGALNEVGVQMEQYDMGEWGKTNEKGIADMGEEMGKVAWFKDTEGNILRLEGK